MTDAMHLLAGGERWLARTRETRFRSRISIPFHFILNLLPSPSFSMTTDSAFNTVIFQTPLNIFVRQGQPTKLNCWHKDGLLFKAGERLQGIITLSKNISATKPVLTSPVLVAVS